MVVVPEISLFPFFLIRWADTLNFYQEYVLIERRELTIASYYGRQIFNVGKLPTERASVKPVAHKTKCAISQEVA